MRDSTPEPTLFADSVSPALIPGSFTHVAGYATGRYAWAAEEIKMFERHLLIGVLPNYPGQAQMARVLDVERYDATPADFPAFAQTREAKGFGDATVYCSLVNVAAVVKEMQPYRNVPWRLWAAWWVGADVMPTASAVLNELDDGFGVQLTPSRLWACQFATNADNDTSVLYGTDDFTRRA